MLNDTGYGNAQQLFDSLTEAMLTSEPELPLAPLDERMEWGCDPWPPIEGSLGAGLFSALVVYLIGALVTWQLMEWCAR